MWKTILEIKAGSKWKVFQGEVGGTIQRLFWVFHGRLLPYRQLFWLDDLVVCWLKIHSEISIQFCDNEAVWNTMTHRGISMFDVTIHDCCIHHIDYERIMDVLYRDHDYTVSNLNEQCQIIHQWFNVWGLSEQDYEIAEPERELANRYIHNVGIFSVKILTSVRLPFYQLTTACINITFVIIIFSLVTYFCHTNFCCLIAFCHFTCSG